MRRSEWGGLKPEQVADWINFDATDSEWHYATCERISMPARQAEGVAGLWNKLSMHNVALLADEVGMGKTFQALGIMALLWKLKPSARVLVMAPNRDICHHWAREYAVFLRDHYRGGEHLISDGPARRPRHETQIHKGLKELVEAVGEGGGQLHFTTIHSLSNLVSHDEKETGDVLLKAQQAAASIHRTLKSSLGDKGFDLVVVDEAHYFRNADGESQRAKAARKFFGEKGDRLGQKVLLLTATPSHSSPRDIASILGYFIDTPADGQQPDPDELLAKYALRRLRLMQGAQGYRNKYNYRHEKSLPASFHGNPEAEMFFALYQKKLVQQQGQNGNGRRFLYGYLEGFESIGTQLDVDVIDAAQAQQDHSTQAFTGAPDTRILTHLTQLHREYFHSHPEHPKYDTLMLECQPENVFDTRTALHDHKHLVFVRRIASVREITQRMNAASDQMLARRIVQAWQPEDQEWLLERWRKAGWSRRFFNQYVSQQASVDLGDQDFLDDEEQTEVADAQGGDEKLASHIADLFVVKKHLKDRSTDCSNFSLRLRKPESLFSLLLEPASDYRQDPYAGYDRKRVGERDRDDYGAAALRARLALHGGSAGSSGSAEGTGCTQIEYDQPMPCLWGLMYEGLPKATRQRLDTWLDSGPRGRGIAENFGNYVKTGFLFASPVIIELYSWFTEFRHVTQRGDAQSRYLAFVDWLKPRLPDSLIRQYFIAALDSFEQICEKITDHALVDWRKDWRVLTSLQSPAWYASGQSGNRQRLILGFNSPFYPNVLVATSVFQEGVNLHLQCSKVHHYGIAWTPGDNEQRVGRVDRLFGQVNRQLQEQGETELVIHYPYLTRSFDQEQLASFVLLKHAVETRMDACRHTSFNDEIDLRNVTDDWEQYLRKPVEGMHTDDPFPACFEDRFVPKKAYVPRV
ncbi:DEAD/DEAH box helicase family protein [Pseudomonas sp. B21-017]|uniref:DEAD/DEAH box helicase family protein n=1 Tax=Pseudomonas sp. B21-017 TaxID=2895474 RepID=UPI002160D0CA|nr:DEAD/DEAH box helicase family protein [Pseudomonas sp. B21-017]UVM39521.1 DEAD/DEAH box helicase family protein [Pseudomonas sp. B21-017]